MRTGSEVLLTGKATGTARWHRRVPDADAGQQDRETFPGRLVRVGPFTGNHPAGSAALGWWNTMITSISEPRGVEFVARRARLLGASFRFRAADQSSFRATAFGVTFIFGSYSTATSLASAPIVARSSVRQSAHGP